MAKENLKGTCPACFGHFVVVKGLIRKHGWSEMGGRQVGVYGHAYHTGECFGVGYEPFEKSTKGTIAFIEYLGKLLVTVEARLAYFNARPDMFYTGKITTGYGRREESCEYMVKLKPGMTRVSGLSFNYKIECPHFYHPAYEDHLKSMLAGINYELNSIKNDLEKCHTAVKNWELKDLFVEVKKVRLVHKPGTTRSGRVMFTACDKTVTALMGGRTLALVSFDPEHVTCPDCLKL